MGRRKKNPDEDGDDLCDMCHASGVHVDRTTYCGKTIGIECGCDEYYEDGTCDDDGCEACKRGGKKKNPAKDIVIFRRFNGKNGGDVIALFPEIPASRDGTLCESYMHVGQHSGADCGGVVHGSYPARTSEDDVYALYKELQRSGYDLVVKQKESAQMRAVRRAAAQAVVSGAKVK